MKALCTPPWLSSVAEYSWLIECAFLLALIFSTERLLKKLSSKWQKRKQSKPLDCLSCMDKTAFVPIRILLWVFFAAFLIDLAARFLGVQDRIPNITPLRNAGIIACMAWFLLSWQKALQWAAIARSTEGKSTLKPGSIELIGKFATAAILFIALLLILSLLGLNIAPLIAFGGIGAAALGFSSKDVVANFYGGLVLHLTRPFLVNDLIELPHKKIEGRVEEIGWYFTTIRDMQKRPIYIPNAAFSTEFLVNPSRMTHRRIEGKLSVRFEDAEKVEALTNKIRLFLTNHQGIDSDQPIHVYAIAFGPSSIELEIKAYTFATRYEDFMEVKQKVLIKTYALVYESGAQIPFPITEIMVRPDTAQQNEPES